MQATKSIQDRIADFEKDPTNKKSILAYRHWDGLSDAERARIWEQWKTYYELCSVSEEAAIFWELKQNFNARNMSRFKELVAMNHKKRINHDFIKEPQTIDPYWVHNNQGVQTYRKLMTEKNKPTSAPDDIFA